MIMVTQTSVGGHELPYAVPPGAPRPVRAVLEFDRRREHKPHPRHGTAPWAVGRDAHGRRELSISAPAPARLWDEQWDWWDAYGGVAIALPSSLLRGPCVPRRSSGMPHASGRTCQISQPGRSRIQPSLNSRVKAFCGRRR